MSDVKEIKLGWGFAKIKLGMSEKDILAILGPPEEVEEQEYSDGGIAKTLYYNDEGFDLTFESEDEYKLSYMSFYDEKFLLGQKVHTGMTREQVLKAVTGLGFSEPDTEDISNNEDPNQELISYDDENCNLWFTDEILDEIQIGPFWQDDDTPIWP